MEKIDILLASYNGEKYIKEQLDSLINQTYKNINIIISDDCSTDKTTKILDEYEEKYDNIHVFKNEKNLGYKKNFEFLLSKVESKYFMLSDQDDVWLDDKVEKTYNKLIEEKADLVYTDLIVVDENLNKLKDSYWKVIGKEKKIKYDDMRTLYLDNVVTGCTILCSAKLINDVVPIPDESVYMLHDYWLALVAVAKGKIAHLNEGCILYRQHTNNQIGSSKKSLKMKKFSDVRDMFIEIKKEHFEIFLKHKDLFNDYYNELNQKAIKYYDNISNKKVINFKGYGTFHKLYKYESFSTRFVQFFVLNLPIFGEIGFFFVRLAMNLRKDKK